MSDLLKSLVIMSVRANLTKYLTKLSNGQTWTSLQSHSDPNLYQQLALMISKIIINLKCKVCLESSYVGNPSGFQRETSIVSEL